MLNRSKKIRKYGKEELLPKKIQKEVEEDLEEEIRFEAEVQEDDQGVQYEGQRLQTQTHYQNRDKIHLYE